MADLFINGPSPFTNVTTTIILNNYLLYTELWTILAAPEERNTCIIISCGIFPASATSPLSLSSLYLSPLSLSPVSTPLPSASSSPLASPISEVPTVPAPTSIIGKRRSSRLLHFSVSSSVSHIGAPDVNNTLNTRVLRKRA